MNRQKGMSLIELMVAMGLGLFLILGVVNVFIANKDSTQVETSLARLQENGRIALDMLVSDIRDANFFGCGSALGGLDSMVIGLPNWAPIQGWEHAGGGWTPTLPGGLNDLTGLNRVGSDVLNIVHGRNIGSNLLANVNAPTDTITIDNNPDCIQTGENVIVSSCFAAFLFEVTNAPTCNDGNTSFEFGASANNGTVPGGVFDTIQTDILQSVDKVWYVADTGRRRTAANIPVYALYRRIGVNDFEMIEGVEYLQINYGQVRANGNLRYVPASDGNLIMDDVVAIRIALLLQSFEMVLDTPDTSAYQVLDQTIDDAGTTFTHNGDRTLRRVFSTTVLLRN